MLLLSRTEDSFCGSVGLKLGNFAKFFLVFAVSKGCPFSTE